MGGLIPIAVVDYDYSGLVCNSHGGLFCISKCLHMAYFEDIARCGHMDPAQVITLVVNRLGY